MVEKDWYGIVEQFDKQGVWRKVRHRITAARRRVMWAAASVALLAGSLLFFNTRRGELPVIAAGQARAVIAAGNEEFVLTEVDQERGWQKFVPAKAETMRITVPRGGEYKLTLDDGTQVWLNSESVIEYTRPFDRHVRLTGEALMDVAWAEGREFTVESPRQRVVVTGTRFNIADYAADAVSHTTLVEGRVAVNDVVLNPGQQAATEEQKTMVREVDTTSYTSWTSGVFEFENMRLEDICARLERWYDVKFTLSEEAAEERFTGGTWKYEPLNDLLTSIEMVAGVRFAHHGNTITVKK